MWGFWQSVSHEIQSFKGVVQSHLAVCWLQFPCTRFPIALPWFDSQSRICALSVRLPDLTWYSAPVILQLGRRAMLKCHLLVASEVVVKGRDTAIHWFTRLVQSRQFSIVAVILYFPCHAPSFVSQRSRRTALHMSARNVLMLCCNRFALDRHTLLMSCG